MSTDTRADSLDFAVLASDPNAARQPSGRQPFEARDGTTLTYRYYASDADIALVLIHGSGTDSRYLATLARGLAASGTAAVYTPDIRGHGPSPVRRGDIDYIDQLEDDLADMIAHIEATHPEPTRIVVGGHSSGGGLAIRFAGGEHGHLAGGYLLLAPYLGHDAPTVRDDSGGWANANVVKIIALSLLNEVGVTRFNGLSVLHFNLPPEYRDGSETLAYSYRLMKGFAPAHWQNDLSAMSAPVMLLAGAEDEAFFAERFEPTVRPYVPHAKVTVLPDASHLGLVVSPAAIERGGQWLQTLARESR